MITLWSKFWCIRVSQEQQQKFPHGDLRLFWSRKLKFWDLHIFSIYFNVFGVSVHIVFYVLVFSNHIHWYILSMTSLTKSHQLQFVLLGKIWKSLSVVFWASLDFLISLVDDMKENVTSTYDNFKSNAMTRKKNPI